MQGGEQGSLPTRVSAIVQNGSIHGPLRGQAQHAACPAGGGDRQASPRGGEKKRKALAGAGGYKHSQLRTEERARAQNVRAAGTCGCLFECDGRDRVPCWAAAAAPCPEMKQGLPALGIHVASAKSADVLHAQLWEQEG